MLELFMYIIRLASNEIFSPSNKIHREVGRAKDLSAPLYLMDIRNAYKMKAQLKVMESHYRPGQALRVPEG